MEADGIDIESINSSISATTSATTSSPGEHLKPLPGVKSKIWKYFGFGTNEAGGITNKSRVKCTICKKGISFI